MKRTPLARSTTMKRSPLRRISAKRRRENVTRRQCLAIVRARCGDRCEMRVSPDCRKVMECGHEKLPCSAGGSRVDPDNVLGSCWPCNYHVHNVDPETAYARGFLLSRYPGRRTA